MKTHVLVALLAFGLLLFAGMVHAQFYTRASVLTGGSQVEEVAFMQTVNEETYVLGTTRSSNFPVTNGSVYRGNLDMTLVKYGPDGEIQYATYIGGLGNDFPTAMVILNNEVYLTLYTDSINFPVTNGSTFSGRRDAVVVKLSSTGNILFATYLGGSGNDIPAFNALWINNNKIYIAGTSASPNFPVTTGAPYQGGVSDSYAAILDAQSGNLLAARFWGGNKEDFLQGALADNQSIYLLGSTKSADIPCSIGSPLPDTQNIFIARLNLSDLGVAYSRYIGGSKEDQMTQFLLSDNMIHVTGYTASPDLPATNGTQSTSILNDLYDGYYTRLNPDGSIQFLSYLTTEDRDNPLRIIFNQGNTYIGGTSISIDGKKFATLTKIEQGGNIGYSRKYQIGTSTNNNIIPSFLPDGNHIVLTGVTLSAAYPVTNGSQFFSSGTGFYSYINENGFMEYSSYLGNMSNLLPAVLQNGMIYLNGQSSFLTYPASNQSVPAGGADNIFIVLRTDGTRLFSGYWGGASDELPKLSSVTGDRWLVAGRSSSANFPVTINQTNRGNGDIYLTMIRSCPTSYRLNMDQLTPDSQVVCKTGWGEEIAGPEIMVPGDSLPLIYRSGIVSQQLPVLANYQWQTSFNRNGPWTDIAGATFRTYTPTLGSEGQYYRRASYAPAFCGAPLIHYSDTVVAQTNNLMAPVVTGTDPFITCPGFPVTIGGNPTASGGNPPYMSYAWDRGLPDEPNPIVSPTSGTIYTLTVTDSMGCKQVGQFTVLTYSAAAGPDQGACGGQPAIIGSAPIPGLPGIQYSWQPSGTLNNPTIAQPQALPTVATDYILQMQLSVTGGSVCSTLDTVRVTPVNAPVTPNFAGTDKIFCLGSSALLGLPAEAGFNYVWSPGNYLTSNASSTTSYYAGNQVMPIPNPAVVSVTAQKAGCFFPDQATVAVIEARAGRDGCGPRIIGLPDRTPDINETYSWTKVSGPGTFTGPTNIPQPGVTASVDSPTIYRLTVTYNGQSCVDDVMVPPFCTNCQTLIYVDAQYSCPSYSANGGNVTLYASTSITNATFSWTPQEGLSNYNTNLVQLTDNIPRTYTVTAYDPLDSTRFCSDRIVVNDPSFVRPVFPAPDTITCAGQPVMIGATNVSGYSYSWIGNGLSSNLISNPIATVNTSTAFPVTVSDSSRCILQDTVLVVVQNAIVNAGPDKIICSSGNVKLGTPAQPNTTYLWEPQASPWQNSTNQFSAQPEVFVASDLSFFVTATTSAGCVIRDTVQVQINANPSIPDAPDTSTCLGTAVRIGTPAINGVTYQWSPSTGLNSATTAQPLANPSVTTTYTVSASFPGTCITPAVDQVTVTVRSAVFSMPDISFCPENGPVALGTNAPAGMLSYSWQPAAAVSNPGIANPTTLNPPPKINSTYTLLVLNPNGCQYRDTILLIPSISAPQAGPDRTICKGDSIPLGTTANLLTPGIQYVWSPSLFLNNPNSPNPIFHPLSGGTFMYVLVKTDSATLCSSRDTVVLTVQDISFPMASNLNVCQNSCIRVGTNPVTGIFYQWSPATGLSDPTAANPLACVETSLINYTLTATNLNGCRVSQSLILSVSPVPAAQISIPDVVGCLGDTTLQFNPVISPPGPYQYLWSPNDGSLSDIRAANPRIRVLSAGIRNYLLQVTDTVSGCFNSANARLELSACDPNVVIGDFVWFDANQNGLQDTGEAGIGGVNVRLFNAAGFQVAATTTNPAGLYFFSNVSPGNGYYTLFSLPAGYMFTDPLVGGPGSDINSKVNDTGRSISFNVSAGSSLLNIDAGIKICGSGGPVPVTLLNFSASVQNKSVMLYWQTSAEYKNDYFLLERSRDGVHFQPIGRVNGHGTTSLPQSYQWPDWQPLNGMNLYRLKQVDIDGAFSYSRIIPVKFEHPSDIIVVYQEATHSIQINFSNTQPATLAVLYNTAGQRITGYLSQNQVNSLTLRLPYLPKGVYTLLLGNDKIFYSTRLLIGK